MSRHTFFCIDAHTCGNPVRVVAGGAPHLPGASMMERRQYFLDHFDWIRTALMFEPRGHEVMSGAILYPPLSQDADLGLLFIEVSGCLPMCGHGTIGTVTVVLEQGLVTPRNPGRLVVDTPAGPVVAEYRMDGEHVDHVRIRNVASYLHAGDVKVDVPDLGRLSVDIAYGGNFYAIVDPQPGYDDLSSLSAADIQRLSPVLRHAVNQALTVTHPDDPHIAGVSHVMWTGRPCHPDAHARNAVFYGDKAIDRSPCGTGSSARMAQLHARDQLAVGQDFIHESLIGTLFHCRIEGQSSVGNLPAILPSVQGWARIHGLNTVLVDDRDPLAHGFLLP